PWSHRGGRERQDGRGAFHKARRGIPASRGWRMRLHSRGRKGGSCPNVLGSLRPLAVDHLQVRSVRLCYGRYPCQQSSTEEPPVLSDGDAETVGIAVVVEKKGPPRSELPQVRDRKALPPGDGGRDLCGAAEGTVWLRHPGLAPGADLLLADQVRD